MVQGAKFVEVMRRGTGKLEVEMSTETVQTSVSHGGLPCENKVSSKSAVGFKMENS